MIVTIHQPEHLPWLGFFDKVRQADVFVLLDHVQFRKHYFQNRNRLRSSQGALWLTVPVHAHGMPALRDVKIAGDGGWAQRHWRTVRECYGKSPHFERHAPFFQEVYQRQWESLAELNETLIRYLLSALGIQVELLRSSALELEGKKGELVLEICRRLRASTYVSGVSGREYLDLGAFAQAGIEVVFQEFHHPVYAQRFEPFLPCMSSVDLLFNHGPRSLDILAGHGVERLDHIFK